MSPEAVLAALRQEYASGPLAAELAPLLYEARDAEAAAVLNDPRFTHLGEVPRSRFAMWAGATGLRSVIEAHAGNQASPLNSIALTLLDFLRGGAASAVDFGEPENVSMLDAFVQAGGITAEQRDALLALATVPASRAEIVIGRPVTPREVGEAR